MEREISTVAKNGIKIYALKNPAVHGFSLSLFLLSGSMYEGEGESGITHFLEHIAIRNVNEVMGGELYRTLDRHGLEFNASSFAEMVQFYVYGSSKKLALGAQLLSRVLSPIILSTEEIERERSRIKAEIREGDERGSLSSFSNKIVYEGTSLAGTITGSVGSVNKITKKKLEEYRRRVFTSDNLFIYLVGSFSDEDLSTVAEVFDTELENSSTQNRNIAPVPRKFGKRDGRVQVKNADYTMMRFSFDVDMGRVGVRESDLLYEVLLGGNSSRFYIEMSEKKGLFYDVSGTIDRYRNIGSFVFSFEVRQDKIYEAAECVIDILKSIKKTLLSEDECMKAGYVDNVMLLCDDVRELGFTMAYDNKVMGLGYSSVDARAAAYDAVTPEQIRAAANEIFRPENLTLTLKGNKRKIDTARLEGIASNL